MALLEFGSDGPIDQILHSYHRAGRAEVDIEDLDDVRVVPADGLKPRLVQDLVKSDLGREEFDCHMVSMLVMVDCLPDLAKLPSAQELQELIATAEAHSKMSYHPNSMARILGAFVRISGGRYVAGLAVIDGDRLEGQRSLPAPGEPEARQLAELYSRMIDAISEFHPVVVAIRASETQARMREAYHAEGVLLAAAGDRNVPAIIKHGRGLVSRAGLPSTARSQDAVQSLISRLDSRPAAPECQQAAAAAVAVAIERGEL